MIEPNTRVEAKGIDAYVIPTADFHQSEYVGDYFKARAYMTGFTGSAGTAVVTRDEAYADLEWELSFYCPNKRNVLYFADSKGTEKTFTLVYFNNTPIHDGLVEAYLSFCPKKFANNLQKKQNTYGKTIPNLLKYMS